MSGGNDKLERELESFLGDDSRVAALYGRLRKDEPDARLDATILAQARAATSPRRARPRWLPALSAAAALVVVAGLAYRVGPQVWNERSAVSEKAAQNVAAPPKPTTPAPQPAPPSAPAQADADAASLRPAPMSGNAPTSSNAVPMQAQVAREAPPVSDKAPRQSRRMETQKSASGSLAPQSAQLKKTQPSASDNVDSSSATPSRGETEFRAKSVASPPRLDAAPAPAAEPVAAAPAPAPARATRLAQPAALAFPGTPASAASSSAAGAPTSSPPPARQMSAKPIQSAADVEVNLYPEHWITDIQQMLKDGRRDDAIKNLEAFRKRYPDYKLPDDLRDLK